MTNRPLLRHLGDQHPAWIASAIIAGFTPFVRLATLRGDWPNWAIHIRFIPLIVLAWFTVDCLRRPSHRIAAVVSTWLVTATVILLAHPEGSTAPTSLVQFGLGDGWPGASIGPGIALVAVGIVVVPWLERSGRRRRRLDPPHWAVLAVTAAGPLFGDAAVDVIGRQHVERVDVIRGEIVSFDGPIVPTAVWSITLALTVAIVFLGIGSVVVRRLRCWAVPPLTFAHRAAVVAAGAFLVRFATLLTVAPTRTDGGDPLFYHSTANILARGGGFPEPLNFIAHQDWIASALHGPLYPVVLSFTSRFGGSTYVDHKLLSLLIGTAVVVVTMLVARRVAPPERADTIAVVAGGLAAVYPNLWLVDGVLFPEGLMALCTLLVVLFAYRWREHPVITWSIAMGAATALAALTRGEGLLLSVLVITPWILRRRDLPWRRRISQLGAAALACILVLAPWTVRNLRSFDDFVPLSTNGNELFVYANCDDTYSGSFLGFWQWDCQQRLRDQGVEPSGDEAAKALYWREVGLDYARENASQLPKVVAARVLRQWDLFRPWQNADLAPVEGRNRDAARAGLVMYYGLLAGSAVGVVALRRRRRPILPLVAQIVSVTLTAAYAYGTTRFRVPAEPVLCIFAAVGLVTLSPHVRRRWSRRPNRASRTVDPADEATDSECAFVHGGSPRSRRPSVRILTPWLVIGGWIALALPALYRAVGSTMEEGFMLVFPERVVKGAVANVDFLHLYGPGSLHVLSLWYRLFDVSLISERTFGLVQHLLVVTGLFVLTRPWGRSVATWVALVSTLFVFTPIGLQALAWSGAVGFGVWSIVFARRAHELDAARWSFVASGLLTGLAVSFRPDLVLALGLAHGWMWWRGRRARLRPWLTGLAVGCLSYVVHLVQAGPSAMWRGMFVEPVLELRGGRALPRPPSWDHLDGALQVIGEKFAPWWGLPALGTPKQLVAWFFLLPIVAVFVVVVSRRVTPRAGLTAVSGARRADTLMAAGLFGIGLLPQALQRPDSAHFNWVSCISVPLLIVAFVDIARVRFPHTPRRTRSIASVALVVAGIVAVIPAFTARTYLGLVTDSIRGELDPLTVERNGRQFYLGDFRPWLASVEVTADLDRWSRPGERLLVGPIDLRQTAYSDAFFYYLFPDLEPATYFIEMDPGLANRNGSRLADDVASADWLILTRFWSQWIEPNDSIVFGSDLPNQIVEQKFCLRGSYQVDLARVYQRCENGDGIGPYDPPYDGTVDYAVEVRTPVPPRPDGTCTPTCNGEPAPAGTGFNPEAVAAISDAARAVAP